MFALMTRPDPKSPLLLTLVGSLPWPTIAPAVQGSGNEIPRHPTLAGAEGTRPPPGSNIAANLGPPRRMESNPRPPDVKKLSGRPAWRVRVGDCRIIYEIPDRILQIIVITVGHRRADYR